MGNRENDSGGSATTSYGRRAFVKGSAAALGLAAMAGAGISFAGCSSNSLEEATGEVAQSTDEIFHTVCLGACGTGCGSLEAHVRDGKLVQTLQYKKSADVSERTVAHICAKGLTQPLATYASNRVQYPMRRVEGTARGAGQWERITWDEAINEITAKWTEYIAEDSRSVAFQEVTASNSYSQFVYWRLANAFGGTLFQPPVCAAALIIGTDAFGRSQYLLGNDDLDMLQSKYIFMWASNFTTGSYANVRLLWAARDAGAKIIVIDPHFTDIAAKGDMWVPIRPVSDGALALAMTKIIIDEGKADFEYMKKNSTAPFLVKPDGINFLHAADVGLTLEENSMNAMGQPMAADEFNRPIDYIVIDKDGNWGTPDTIAEPVFTGSYTINGIECKPAFQLLTENLEEWTPEKASEVCDIPVDTILELTHMYAEGPSSLALGFALSHQYNGSTTTMCQFTLAIVSGQIGKPGAGINGGQGSLGTTGVMAANFMNALFAPTDEEALGSGQYGHRAFLNIPTEYLPEIQETGTFNGEPYKIKSLFTYCANVLNTLPDTNTALKMYDNIELVITADAFMTETARYSDYVLPVTHWFENNNIISFSTPYIKYSEKAIEPLFEAKSDTDITCLLAKAMGFSGFDLDDDSFPMLFFDSDYCRANDWTLERFKEEKVILYTQRPYIYGNVDYGTVFTNAPARATFFVENAHPEYDQTKQIDPKALALPYFELPYESWRETVGGYEQSENSKKYPLQFISWHDRFRIHSGWSLIPPLLELQAEPGLNISPTDADARGIREGDYVKVFNDRGFMIAKAHIDPTFRPGVVKTEHSWESQQFKENPDGWTSELFKGGSQNCLTTNTVNDFHPALIQLDCVVEVEKTNIVEEEA